MKNKFLVLSFEFLEQTFSLSVVSRIKTKNAKLKTSPGFTLVETLAAVILLTVSITAPMLLTVRSLSSAYYARDQFTAFYLAQEAIEAIHQIRDNQILEIAKSSAGTINLFPFAVDAVCDTSTPTYFTVDARHTNHVEVVRDQGDLGACSNAFAPGSCPSLQSDGELYGYSSGWANSMFTRYVNTCYVGGDTDEVQVSVTVKWKTASLADRTFTISEHMYRWIQDGSGT